MNQQVKINTCFYSYQGTTIILTAPADLNPSFTAHSNKTGL